MMTTVDEWRSESKTSLSEATLLTTFHIDRISEVLLLIHNFLKHGSKL